MTELFKGCLSSTFRKKLITERFVRNILSRKHSGFNVDHDVRIPALSYQAREALPQYIARRMAVPPPISLKKMSIEENGDGTLISYTSNSDFSKGETRTITVMHFLLELTQHIPPRRAQAARRNARNIQRYWV